MNHYVNICQYGYKHGQCRCIGPHEIRKVECDNNLHALNPKAGYGTDHPAAVLNINPATDVVSVPKDVAEYVTGPFKAAPMTKEIWETLISGVVKDQAPNMAQTLDWLHEQYGDWEN